MGRGISKGGMLPPFFFIKQRNQSRTRLHVYSKNHERARRGSTKHKSKGLIRMTDRIKNKGEMEQFLNYDGLKYGKIMPTNIDGFLEFGNKVFVLIELKFKETKMPFGQKLCFERMCDRI